MTKADSSALKWLMVFAEGLSKKLTTTAETTNKCKQSISGLLRLDRLSCSTSCVYVHMCLCVCVYLRLVGHILVPSIVCI